MCFYLRNWQVTFLLYTLGVKITEYIAKAPIEPRDYRVVFLIQKGTPGFSAQSSLESSFNYFVSTYAPSTTGTAIRTAITEL